MSDADYIIVGSGINALVCAAMLGAKGRKVLVLERNNRIGGCIRIEPITAPGFVHDLMATTFVLFTTSPAYAALGTALAERGLVFADSDMPTGVLMPDGRHTVLTAAQGVVCSVAPGQLYRQLLKDQPLPAAVSEGLARFRHGKGNMQMHYALSKPPSLAVNQVVKPPSTNSVWPVTKSEAPLAR